MKNYKILILAACAILLMLTNTSICKGQNSRPSWANQDITSRDQLFAGFSVLIFDPVEDGTGLFGATLEYIHKISRKCGFILDAGYYSNRDGYGAYLLSDRLYHLSAGISYHPAMYFCNPKISLSAHALLGITRYTSITPIGYASIKDIDHAFNAIAGVGFNYRLSNLFTIRFLQIDFAPTFFWDDIEFNPRASAGLVFNLPGN